MKFLSVLGGILVPREGKGIVREKKRRRDVPGRSLFIGEINRVRLLRHFQASREKRREHERVYGKFEEKKQRKRNRCDASCDPLATRSARRGLKEPFSVS